MNTILKITAMMLFAAGSFGSCESKGENPNESVCNVENPLTDLPWLKEIVNGFEKD